MRAFRDLPIRRKLTLIIVATCAVPLSLAAVMVGMIDVLRFRRSLVRNATVLADVLSQNTQAAIAFGDSDAARTTLLALRSEPQVAASCIYDAGGTRFAEYTNRRKAAVFPATPSAPGDYFDDDNLRVFRPILLNGKRLGTIYLQVPLDPLYQRIRLLSSFGSSSEAGVTAR